MTQFSNPLLQLNKPTLEADQDSDQTLIARFVQKQDQAAFELLVKRYHGLVMGVCRRVLGNTADGSTAGIVSGSTNSLAQGILQMYFFGKMKLYAFSSLTALVLAITAYGLIQDTGDRFEKRLRGYIQSIGSNSGSTNVTILLDDSEVLLNLEVAKDVVVHQAYQKTSLEQSL